MAAWRPWRWFSRAYLQPLTLVDPATLSVHDGRPVRRIVAGPEVSTVAVPVTLASIVDVPSAPIAASVEARSAASTDAIPRTSAVSFFVRPASLALPLPTTLTLIWSLATAPITP